MHLRINYAQFFTQVVFSVRDTHYYLTSECYLNIIKNICHVKTIFLKENSLTRLRFIPVFYYIQ